MSGYVLRIAHLDRDNEVISVRCDHGEARNSSTTDTSQALDAVVQFTLGQYVRTVGTGCGCTMSGMEDYWFRWSDARLLFEEDAVNGTRDQMDDGGKAFHATLLRVLKERACPHCDASVLLRFTREATRMGRIHQAGCPEKSSGKTEEIVITAFGEVEEGRA